jgi:hypothetical protein
MKDPYHCPYCNQRSTRRWNLQVHIKRKHGGPPDPYLVSHPSSYKPTNPYHNIESPIIADDVGYSFQPRYDLQQAPLGSNSIYPPRQVMHDQSSWTVLSQDTIVKIDELRRLMNKYPKYHMNPGGIIQWAIHSCLNGDNTFLEDKLDQLRTIDSLAKYYDS